MRPTKWTNSQYVFDYDVACSAASAAKENWDIWEEHFSDSPEKFSQMKLFKSEVAFLGFGYDYSVFRGFKRQHLFAVLEDLRQPSKDLSSPLELTERIKVVITETNQAAVEDARMKTFNYFSLSSKLMTIWQPSKFFMWDTLNRKGLRSVLGPGSGNSFSTPNAEAYDRFTKVMDSFVQGIPNEEVLTAKIMDICDKPTVAKRRFVDNYFVKLGSGIQ